ncbi:TetR/AcrR family transcriptional regulator [Nisaea acidiphila]|uniref:TetR/AcrR family transcriptional regulator n=1 Tax=Nisaea acidiphila TaxID=1862145 RepID=A0A9J7AXI9_9PROT|nr:TetR/AcrR family transcriptional regulator [Nisaea acidiphila]UUX50972.1 TetR/AcrR family transcriptional regulator [Nisaea acidiphila]
MQQKPARRSNRERTEETRSALLAAGRTLFIEKGYAETGTPEIVKAANVTRGALYHHFRDKEDLFRAVVRQEARAVGEEIEASVTETIAPLEALKDGSAAYFNAMAIPGRARLLLLDGPAVLGPEEMSRIDRETGGGSLLEGLAALRGNASDQETRALADMLSAAFDRAALAIAFGESRTEYEAAMGILLEGLFGTGENASSNGNPG